MAAIDTKLLIAEWITVGVIIVLALIVRAIAVRAMKSWLTRPSDRYNPARLTTLRALLTHAITFIVGLLATAFSLAQFVDPASLLTFLGLFSAALGLGARPLVSDYLSGFTLIFEDQFAVGEKVEMAGVNGYVESVDLRTTRIRADTGELFIVPNGDVRNIRNFSRATFSTANVVVTVPTEDLPVALERLHRVVDMIKTEFPTLVEPPMVLSEKGVVGPTTDLTLIVKAPYGTGPETRTRILAILHAELGTVLKAAQAQDPPPIVLTPDMANLSWRGDGL